MEIIKTEDELKHIVDNKGFRFGDRFPSVGFVITYLDSQTMAQIHSIVVKDPIDGLANLPNVAKMAKRSTDNIKVILDFGFDYNSRKVADINYELDIYIYFQRPEKLDSSVVPGDDEKKE